MKAALGGLGTALACLFACAAAARPAAGSAPQATGGKADQPGTIWHVVQPGENLHVLAERYLGERGRWPELWKLNPEVKNPDFLRPGQRLRVPGTSSSAPPEGLLEAPLEGETRAALSRLSQRVDHQPHPRPWWSPAKVGEKLKERDGLRTFESASAELLFLDGMRFLVTERSLIFLRASEREPARPAPRAIEIREGQADVEARPARAGAREVEIVVGPAVARARPTPDDAAQTRARKAATGAAQVMVYRGAGEVRAGGARVDVPKGMGTSVPQGGRPTSPEKLLPAPQPLGPPAGAALGHANPQLTWEEVAGAESYTVELCRDDSCGELVERRLGVKEPRYRVDELPPGRFYWRVTAVSPSGLDGYPSVAVPFSIESRWRRPLDGPP